MNTITYGCVINVDTQNNIQEMGYLKKHVLGTYCMNTVVLGFQLESEPSFGNNRRFPRSNDMKFRVLIRDIVHEYTEKQELIRYDNLVWLILGAITLEWVIRRRQGGY